MGYPKDIRSLTRVRFFAALWVVIFHWRASWAVNIDNYTGFFEAGRLGVDIFFVLSGFVLAHVYFPRVRAGTFDYARFLVARLARIYPLHVFMFGFVAAMLVGSAMLGVAPQSDAFPLQHIIPNLLLIQAWGFTPGPTWNVPAWSISAEWFAYLLFPVFALVGLKFIHKPVWGFLLGLALFFAFDRVYLALVGSPLPSATDNFGILRVVPEFLMGFMLYLMARHRPLMSKWLRNGGLALTVGVLVLAAHWRADERFIALLSVPLVYFLAELSKVKSTRPMRLDPAEYLGRVSYSVYLLHVPFFMAAYNLMEDVLGWVDGPLSTLWMLALLVIFFPICMLSYHFVENPAREMTRKWGNQMITSVRAAFSGPQNPKMVSSGSSPKEDIKT